MKKHLLILAGPTASGKTSTAIRLSRTFDAPILNCDSRQFYREMTIGTAKPTAEELAAAPHHFVNNLSIHDTYHVGDYEQEALALLHNLFQERDMAILTGGSGLFIRAVCEGLDAFPKISETAKDEVAGIFTQKGIAGLQDALKALDPDYFNHVDLDNHRRLIRALEVCMTTGQPYSFFLNQPKPARPFKPIYCCLTWERGQLYDRINRRVDIMVKNGLFEEAQSLYPHRHLRPLQTVGYQEIFDYMDGKDISKAETIEKIKRNSRRYAKRQMTWFRNSKAEWFWFHPEEVGEAKSYIKSNIE